MVSVITRLLTILSAFVTGAFLTYLIQLQLIPNKTQNTKSENITSISPENLSSNTTNALPSAPVKPKFLPKPAVPAEKPLDDKNEIIASDIAAKNENQLEVENIGTQDTGTGEANDNKFELVLVEPGDSLSRLAIRHYDNRDYAYNIYEANRDVLKSPDHLVPGMQLKIPVKPEDYN